MSYTIKFSETHDCILVNVKGRIDGETALKFSGESYKLGKKLGVVRFFVDLRNSRNIQKIGDKYLFVINELSNVPEINKAAKVACVVDPDDHSHDFIETVMRNYGFNFTIFRDIKKAFDHLQSE